MRRLIIFLVACAVYNIGLNLAIDHYQIDAWAGLALAVAGTMLLTFIFQTKDY